MLTALKTVFDQYGFGAAMAAFIAIILWQVLKFAKENISQVLEQGKQREDEQRKIIDRQHKAVRKLSQDVKQASEQQTRDHDKISKSLDEVVKAVGRINGYKK